MMFARRQKVVELPAIGLRFRHLDEVIKMDESAVSHRLTSL